MKPLFVVGGLYSKANGVAWIMRDLATALGRAGAPVDVYGAECSGSGLSSIGHQIFEAPTRWYGRKGLWLGGVSLSPRLKHALCAAIDAADVVHNHSVWMLPNSYASCIARKKSKPLVLTAHGALEPWALQHSRFKKKIVGKWFQYKDLRTANCIQVNSESELRGIRQLGLKQPTAIIPNGVNLSDFDDLPHRDDFAESFAIPRHKKQILFMGRLHRKKGVNLLVQAWSELASQFEDWHLVLAGPDDGLRSVCEALVADADIGERVTFTGNLDGSRKLQALAAADVFALPSHSEGFSMAVLEAMACRLPVLLTPGCNFPEATSEGGGILADATIQGITHGLRKLIESSGSERSVMGRCGRLAVERSYTWDRIAEQTLDLYRWLFGTGPEPQFVRRG